MANKDEKSTAKKEKKPAKKKGEKSESWSKAEPWVVGLGRFAWLIGIAAAAVYIIYGITLLPIRWYIGTGIWYIASGAAAAVLSLIYGLGSFSKTCADKDWNFLVNDVIKFGSLRVPKMLFFGILIAVFSNGWGAAGFLIPAILIFVIQPVKMQWKE